MPRAELAFPMRAFEIATIYADIVPGRKQARDLDARREVWATVHRVDPKA
jgi:alpha-mannosidase